MKKLINTVLALTFIVTHIIIELYPTFKRSAKIYVTNLDFNNLLNSEQVAEYVSFLSEEEKAELVSMVSSYLKNTFD